MMVAAILAGLCLTAGSILLYLASPNQRLLRHPVGRAGRWAGWVALAIGQGLLWSFMGVATALFVSLTILMLWWSVVPLVVAWRRGEAKR